MKKKVAAFFVVLSSVVLALFQNCSQGFSTQSPSEADPLMEMNDGGSEVNQGDPTPAFLYDYDHYWPNEGKVASSAGLTWTRLDSVPSNTGSLWMIPSNVSTQGLSIKVIVTAEKPLRVLMNHNARTSVLSLHPNSVVPVDGVMNGPSSFRGGGDDEIAINKNFYSGSSVDPLHAVSASGRSLGFRSDYVPPGVYYYNIFANDCGTSAAACGWSYLIFRANRFQDEGISPTKAYPFVAK